MAHPSKVKGTNFERELVNEARKAGLVAERAYASNGRALGEAEQVDVIIRAPSKASKDVRIQAKRRKSLAAYLQIPPGVDAVVFREDRGDTYVLLRWEDLLDKLKDGW